MQIKLENVLVTLNNCITNVKGMLSLNPRIIPYEKKKTEKYLGYAQDYRIEKSK